jgi:hypothetical protein
MLQSVCNPYPGEAASPRQLLMLADEYRQAAHVLQKQGRAGEPLSRAPSRLVAIHAIELYFNALLLHRGLKSAEIRALGHRLAERSRLAQGHGLHLRKLTMAHLEAMTGNREYLISRYGPEMTATVSQINRLMATLDEVGKKVSRIVTG